MTCTVVGDLPCVARTNDNFISLIIHDVHYVPNHHFSLLSVHQLQLRGIIVSFGTPQTPTLYLPDGQIIPFEWKRNLYELLVISSIRAHPATSMSLANPAETHPPDYHHWKTTSHMRDLAPHALAKLWHSRLHIGTERLRAAAKVASGIPAKLTASPHVTCDCCQLATARRLPHTSARKSAATSILRHCGPIPPSNWWFPILSPLHRRLHAIHLALPDEAQKRSS